MYNIQNKYFLTLSLSLIFMVCLSASQPDNSDDLASTQQIIATIMSPKSHMMVPGMTVPDEFPKKRNYTPRYYPREVNSDGRLASKRKGPYDRLYQYPHNVTSVLNKKHATRSQKKEEDAAVQQAMSASLRSKQEEATEVASVQPEQKPPVRYIDDLVALEALLRAD